MTIFIRSASARRDAVTMGLAAAMLTAAIGTVCAQPDRQSRDDQSYGVNAKPDPQTAPSRWDRARFNRSGTRGRAGLGASPMRPEGPGNVSD
jgi:hypothetical protein